MTMIFTAHVRKEIGDGRAIVRLLQGGQIWQQSFSKIAGAGKMYRAGFYTGDTSRMANDYEEQGWQIVSLANCESML